MTNASQKLSGKAALVTGGSRSIGATIAKRLATDGAAVAITYSASPDKAAAVVKQIEDAGGRAISIHADSGNPESVRAAVAKTEETFGSIDILVNNAGIALGGPTIVIEMLLVGNKWSGGEAAVSNDVLTGIEPRPYRRTRRGNVADATIAQVCAAPSRKVAHFGIGRLGAVRLSVLAAFDLWGLRAIASVCDSGDCSRSRL